MLAHRPVKILVLILTVVLGLALFPRWANRTERRFPRLGPGAMSLPEAGPVQAAGLAGGAADAPVPARGGRVSVDVETRPAGGAVFLDDLPLAEPKVVLALSDAQTHSIRARSGCLEGVAERSAADLLALQGPLVLELREKKEVVAIGSEPPGARLRIDGRDTGKSTPVEIEMDACREQTVDLRLAGHKGWTRTFAAGDDVTTVAAALAAVALEPVPRGTVALPRPKGWSADVFLGGVKIGRAGEPIALNEGTYTLQVRNDQVFARTSVPVVVRGNETTRPAVALPGLGRLTVQAQPSNCKVYVDGAYVDVTPVLDLPIAAGAHDIRVVFVPTGAAKSRDVTIHADRSERVVVKF